MRNPNNLEFFSWKPLLRLLKQKIEQQQQKGKK
jgi:hypothetical protein